MSTTEHPYPFTAHQEKDFTNIQRMLEDLSDKNCVPSVIFYGSKEIEKTVILNEIKRLCEPYSGILCEYLTVEASGKFTSQISTTIYRILLNLDSREADHAKCLLQTFHCKWNPAEEEYNLPFESPNEIGMVRRIAGTGNLSNDLLELLIAVGTAAFEESLSLCLLINDMHQLKKTDLDALISALHRCNQKCIPIYVFGTGIPSITKYIGTIKPYAERMFHFIELNSELKRGNPSEQRQRL